MSKTTEEAAPSPGNGNNLLRTLDRLGLARIIEDGARHDVVVVRSKASVGDDLPDALRAVAALDIDCPGIGTALGGLVVRQLRGEQLTDEIALSPVGRVIGADNLAAWVPLTERIPFEPFHVGLD